MLPELGEILALCKAAARAYPHLGPPDEAALGEALDEARVISAKERDATAAIFVAIARRHQRLGAWCTLLSEILPRYVAFRLMFDLDASDDELRDLRQLLQVGRADVGDAIAWFDVRLRASN